MPPLTSRLLSILGKRVFLSFCVVTFLTAALLAAVNITSRYALKLYVESQLQRTPWDFALYKAGGFTGGTELPDQIRRLENVTQVENLAFLRAILPVAGEVGLEVDGKPLGAP